MVAPITSTPGAAILQTVAAAGRRQLTSPTRSRYGSGEFAGVRMDRSDTAIEEVFDAILRNGPVELQRAHVAAVDLDARAVGEIDRPVAAEIYTSVAIAIEDRGRGDDRIVYAEIANPVIPEIQSRTSVIASRSEGRSTFSCRPSRRTP